MWVVLERFRFGFKGRVLIFGRDFEMVELFFRIWRVSEYRLGYRSRDCMIGDMVKFVIRIYM